MVGIVRRAHHRWRGITDRITRYFKTLQVRMSSAPGLPIASLPASVGPAPIGWPLVFRSAVRIPTLANPPGSALRCTLDRKCLSVRTAAHECRLAGAQVLHTITEEGRRSCESRLGENSSETVVLAGTRSMIMKKEDEIMSRFHSNMVRHASTSSYLWLAPTSQSEQMGGGVQLRSETQGRSFGAKPRNRRELPSVDHSRPQKEYTEKVAQALHKLLLNRADVPVRHTVRPEAEFGHRDDAKARTRCSALNAADKPSLALAVGTWQPWNPCGRDVMTAGVPPPLLSGLSGVGIGRRRPLFHRRRKDKSRVVLDG